MIKTDISVTARTTWPIETTLIPVAVNILPSYSESTPSFFAPVKKQGYPIGRIYGQRCHIIVTGYHGLSHNSCRVAYET